MSKRYNAEFLQIFSGEETNYIYNLNGLRASIFSANFDFWMNHFFKFDVTGPSALWNPKNKQYTLLIYTDSVL